MTDFQNTLEKQESPQRPQGLLVLCILTFISTGLGLISNCIRLLSGPVSVEKMEEENIKTLKMIETFQETGMNYLADLFDKLSKMTISLNEHFYANTMVSTVHVILGATAAFFLLNGRKLGFHLYIVYCLMSVSQLYLFVSPAIVPFTVILWDLLISGIFVFLYSRHMHWLK